MKSVMTILIAVSVFCLRLQAQQTEKIIQAGNDLYKKQKYSDAEKEYRKAIGKDSSGNIAKFNMGNALYKLGEKDEAIRTFNELLGTPNDADKLANLYYNNGVILGSQQKLEESIKAYENALLQNPDDQQTRENLQKALLELKKRNETKNQDKKKQQNKSQPPPSAMNQKEAEKRLKDLEQKEKEIQQRMQNQRSSGTSQQKDW